MEQKKLTVTLKKVKQPFKDEKIYLVIDDSPYDLGYASTQLAASNKLTGAQNEKGEGIFTSFEVTTFYFPEVYFAIHMEPKTIDFSQPVEEILYVILARAKQVIDSRKEFNEIKTEEATSTFDTFYPESGINSATSPSDYIRF